MLSCSNRQDGGDYALHDDYRKNTEHSEILCIGKVNTTRMEPGNMSFFGFCVAVDY